MEKILKALLLLSIPLCLQANFIVQSYQELKNKRVIRQNFEESCGASSLATLLNILDGRNFSEMDMLTMINPNEFNTNMVSFADLNQTVKKLGYESQTYQITRDILEKLMDLPLLVKIEYDQRFPHFVIIINHKGDYLEVLDPSHGAYISSKEQFFSVWDKEKQGGYALIVVPKQQHEYPLHLPKQLFFELTPFRGL